jgi:hypothetical protein
MLEARVQMKPQPASGEAIKKTLVYSSTRVEWSKRKCARTINNHHAARLATAVFEIYRSAISAVVAQRRLSCPGFKNEERYKPMCLEEKI